MYAVLVERVVKRATGNTEKFSPRTTNNFYTDFLGPFIKRRTAERVVVGASATHTCMSAVIVDRDGVEDVLRSVQYPRATNDAMAAKCRTMLRMMASEESYV